MPTTPISVKLDDSDADRVRISHARAITELQDQAEELVTGRLIGEQILTGSGIYTPTPGTMSAIVVGIGQGGGGGGVHDTGSGAAVGSGGNSGTKLRRRVTSPNGNPIKGGPFVGGSTGGAGGSGASNGAAGANSTLSIAGLSLVAAGGAGGGGANTTTGNLQVTTGAQPGGTTTAGGIFTYGHGAEGEALGAVWWFSGRGGTTDLGAGGPPVTGSNNGVAGSGLGGGGSGAATQGTLGDKTGGNGAPGGWHIQEYA